MPTISGPHTGHCGQGQIAAVTTVWPDPNSTITNTAEALAAYLKEQAGIPFSRGKADCCALCCDWIVLRRGVDPIAQWRGYSTDAEAAALVRAQGSMVRLAGLAMRRTGFRLTRDPRPGDVAVVAPMSGTHQTCAIRTERGWVMRLDDGIAMIPAGQMRVLAAWRV